MDELEDVDDRVLAVPTKRKRKGSANSTKSNGKRAGNRERTASGASGGSTGSTRYSINPNTQYTDSEDLEAGLSGSDASDLDEDLQRRNGYAGAPTVKTFDTLLKYILRQKGQYREALLDVYANPQLQPLILTAFGEMKQLRPDQQEFLWPALLKRWAKYTR